MHGFPLLVLLSFLNGEWGKARKWLMKIATPHVAGLAAYLMTLDGLTAPNKILSKIRSLATNHIIVGSLGGSSNKLACNGNRA